MSIGDGIAWRSVASSYYDICMVGCPLLFPNKGAKGHTVNDYAAFNKDMGFGWVTTLIPLYGEQR